MTYTVFDINASENTLLFLDKNNVGISRSDHVLFPVFAKLVEKQNSFMWRPTEVDISRDRSDFKTLTLVEQHIFTSNLKRQILLDNITARSPSVAFLPLCSQPEIEEWIQTWTYFEALHSTSYQHIIKNVYPSVGETFDQITEIPEILACATDIAMYYDDLIKYTQMHQLFDGKKTNMYDLKKKLYLAIMSANILEGIRFYVSFSCSWAFFEQKKTMEGNAKIIKLICRDENIHLAATQHMIKELKKSDPDFLKIAEETKDECVKMFSDVLEQEKAWAKYLFKDGSMLGLNYEMLVSYLDWLVHKRMQTIGLPALGKAGANPLPWTTKWIGGSTVQEAPQETQKTSYTMGGVKQDVSTESFKGFSL